MQMQVHVSVPILMKISEGKMTKIMHGIPETSEAILQNILQGHFF